VPLAQLIGLRGPILDLFRNLAWLLAFQTTFIALFGCIPRAIGSFAFNQFITRHSTVSTTMHFLIKTILFAGFDLRSEEGQPMDLVDIVKIITEENQRHNSLLQPKDVAKIVFGCISMSCTTFLLQALAGLYQKYSKARDEDKSNPVQGQREDNGRQHNIDDNHRMDPDALRPEEMGAYITDKLCAAIDCAAAMSKISILVCFKMFVLPFLLGSWLDLSTLNLFDSNVEQRVAHAGADIVGFFLVHWVVGITFMLTVTVSVLQLREVLHPDLLAPVIRPQEPQPDLLATLLQESGWTHVKRMVPSLGIYAAILAIHVWLPCKLISLASVQQYIPLFRPTYWYVLYSPLQRPIELLVFHLSVLSILEKHKNGLGEMQHAIILKFSNFFGLTDRLLPQCVNDFVLIGERPLHKEEQLSKNKGDVDQFWDQLIALNKESGDTDQFIESQMHLVKPADYNVLSQKVGNPDLFILLSPGNADKPERKLMSTRIGSFRFRKKIGNDGSSVIEIWRELVGEAIPRPPEGWDYLGDGGAVEQGRWAWGKKEKKSEIEHKVAQRRFFFPPVLSKGVFVDQWKTRHFWTSGLPVVMKLLAIYFVSWVAVTICVSTALFAPLFIGRLVLWVLEVPSHYVHDPFVFFLGGTILAPMVMAAFSFVCGKKGGEIEESSEDAEPYSRTRNFYLPPFRKVLILVETLTLWFVFCPLVAGTIYQFLFIRTIPASLQVDVKMLMSSWPVGFMIMHFWAALCYAGAFGRGFWREVRQIAIDGIAGGAPPAEGDNNIAPGRQQGQGNNVVPPNNEAGAGADNNNHTPSVSDAINNLESWQGKNGAVSIFAETMFAVLVKQEWDKIDQFAMLHDFLIPLTRQLLILFLAPICALVSAIIATSRLADFGRIVEEEAFRMYLYQYSTLSIFVLQLALCCQASLASWYNAAHKAARDHRYLIGEVLLNYNPKPNYL